MKMIRHQCVRMNLQETSLRSVAQTVQKEGVILLGAKDVAAVVPSVDDVVGQARALGTT